MAGEPTATDRAARPLSVGGELAPTLVMRLAAEHRFKVEPWAIDAAEAGEIATAPALLLTLRGSIREMGLALSLDARAYVEIEDGAAPLPPGLPEWLQRPDRLHLSVSTVTCFGLDLAPVLCRRLVQLGWLGDNRRPDVEICLHEAVSNAVIHGNLGISSGPDGGAQAFDDFYRQVKERLTDRLRALRRVTVEAAWTGEELALVVADEGNGHPGVAKDSGPAGSLAKSGRGLGIMGQLADHVGFSDAGRRIHLHFRR